MKKYILIIALFLFACGGEKSDIVYIPPQSQTGSQGTVVCTACLGWTSSGNTGTGVILWTSSADPLPVCNATTCDSAKFNCASFISYTLVSLYDKNQCL